MARGKRRTEIEILQDQIAAASKKLQKSQDEVGRQKKEITKLEKQKDQTFAAEVAKACRTKNIPLEKVLAWVLEQPVEEAPAPVSAKAKPLAAKPKVSAGKAATKKTAAKRPRATKPAAKAPIEANTMDASSGQQGE